MLNTVLFALALPALLSRPSFVLSQPQFLAEFGDFTPVGAVGDYPLGLLSKDKDTIDDKVVNTSHSSSKISTNVAMRLGAGKDGVVLSSLFAAGMYHTCAQEYEGPFYCWGGNGDGQLGDGTFANKKIPTVINLGDGKNVVDTSAGNHHTCVIDNSGVLYCWGANGSGELGDGTTENKNSPTLIKLGDGKSAVDISAGACHTCVIDNSGVLYCWGANYSGELGDGTNADKNRPTLIKLGDGKSAVDISAGSQHTCVINNSGVLYCWGNNAYGELGDGTNANKNRPTLIKLGDGENVVQVAAGGTHTCAINNSGALYCWGNNAYGELGDGTNANKNIPTLIKLGNSESVVQVVVGHYHTCVINDSGALYCWGYNGEGEVGDGTTATKLIPTLIKLGDGEIADQLVAGAYHTCVLKGLKDTGELICWGDNSYGQLGDNATANRLTATNGNVIMNIQTSKTPTVKLTENNSEQPSSEPSDKTYKLRLSVCSV